MPFIDLHTHSSCSDGHLSPARLVRLARDRGLAAIAITDHDTTAGIAEALAAGRKEGIEVIAGIEISAFLDHHPMHILGYFIDPGTPELQNCLSELQRIRQQRNREIQQKLARFGIRITDRDLAAVAAGQTGRPHFARILVARGVVRSTDEAFVRFLRRNAAAYAPKAPFDACRAIEAITAGGGLAVLAHPNTFSTATVLPAIIARLVDCGLAGIEGIYPSFTPALRRQLAYLADKFGLAVTGGSDYHGDDQRKSLAGTDEGSFSVPYRLLEAMKEKLAPRLT